VLVLVLLGQSEVLVVLAVVGVGLVALLAALAVLVVSFFITNF
jgi:hypothetical protein